MTEHKFTDEQIIEALKICASDSVGCEGCCYRYLSCPDCVNMLGADALDLIKRQRAEIAEYQKHIDQDIIYVHRVKAEAVKEFAERLEIEFLVDGIYAVIVKNTIHRLVKEMTEGDQNGTVGSTQ